jgi:LuxR family maltose regulon positive regulatory protein
MPLLGTKLRVPTPRRQLVARARLVDRLRVAPTAMPRLVLVCAPAGCGKTTVLTQWLAPYAADAAGGADATGLRVAWLSLDERDADLQEFLTHVIAALRTTGPDLGADALARLEANRPVDDVLVSLVNDLETSAQPTVLALDDYHVADAPEVHEAVNFLLDNLPPQVSLAMTTRADPPLPLARLRARGELLELRGADLRFTVTEAEAFLNDVMGLRLEHDQVAALEARTEGWVAGLQLAALSARGHAGRDDVGDFLEAFTGSHRFVLDYLVDEVLQSQPPEVREFLLDTSVLAQLSGPLCDTLTGGDDGARMLESLERANLFLVPLDDHREWYRYHHLFAASLRAQLAASSPDRVRALHAAAARWYADEGTLDEAVPHALAGDDEELAADLVELALPGLRQHRRDRRLRDWVLAVPQDVAARRPVLAVAFAWTRLLAGDLDGLAPWLDAAQATLDGYSDGITGRLAPRAAAALGEAVAQHLDELLGLPAWIEVYRASVAQARADLSGTAHHAGLARSLARPDDHVVRGAADGFLGLAAWGAGDLVEAVDTFSDAARSLHLAGNLTDEVGMSVVLAAMWQGRGRPDEARRVCERALTQVQGLSGPVLSSAGDVHVALADTLRESGDLGAATAHLETARSLGEHASLLENRHRWSAVAAGVARARGDLDEAVALLDRAEADYLPGFFPDLRPVAAQRARVWIAQGRLADATSWADRHHLGPDDEVGYLAEFAQLTLARLLVAHARAGDLHRATEAIGLLDRVLADARAKGRDGSVVEALAVRALAHRASGDLESAVADLAGSLVLGIPPGFRRVFLDEGAPMTELLRVVAGRTDVTGSEQAAILLEAPAAPGPASTLDVVAMPAEPLSERELDVLRLLATDLTGPEIARTLFVAVNTLRTHTKHIFTKLEVNTRRSAVRRASELGLL